MPSKMRRTGAVNGRSPAFLEEQFLHEGTTPSNFVRGLRTGTGADGCAGSRRMGGRRSGRGAGYGKVYPHHRRCRRDAAGGRRCDGPDRQRRIRADVPGRTAPAALAELDELARKGLVRRDSIRTDEENGMVSFTYRCGVLGGILLTLPDELDEMTFDAGDNGLRAPRDMAQCTPRTPRCP